MNFIQTAKNVEEVKLLLDNLARSLTQKFSPNAEIRRSAIRQDLAVIPNQEHFTPNESDLRDSDGVILYTILKHPPNTTIPSGRRYIYWSDTMESYAFLYCPATTRRDWKMRSSLSASNPDISSPHHYSRFTSRRLKSSHSRFYFYFISYYSSHDKSRSMESLWLAGSLKSFHVKMNKKNWSQADETVWDWDCAWLWWSHLQY